MKTWSVFLNHFLFIHWAGFLAEPNHHWSISVWFVWLVSFALGLPTPGSQGWDDWWPFYLPILFFIWMLEIQTPILTLAWQALFPTEPSPWHLFLNVHPHFLSKKICIEESFIKDWNTKIGILKSQQMIVLNNDVNGNAYNETTISRRKLWRILHTLGGDNITVNCQVGCLEHRQVVPVLDSRAGV